MKSNLLPTLPEVGREAIIVLAGAVLAAVIVGFLPDNFKQWMRDQWGGVPKP